MSSCQIIVFFTEIKLKLFSFQTGAVFGWIGYAFFDFNNQEFLV